MQVKGNQGFAKKKEKGKKEVVYTNCSDSMCL